MIYEENQFRKIVSKVDGVPRWLLLGGPADANEAQCAKQHFPHIKVVAFEPLPTNCQWQAANGFPSDGILVQCALSDSVGLVDMNLSHVEDNGHRCSSLVGNKTDYLGGILKVPTTTLDTADIELGPFSDAILWIDIEGSELKALEGASKLLSTGAIQWINLELNSRLEKESQQIDDLLASYGFFGRVEWNIRHIHESIIKDVFYRKSVL